MENKDINKKRVEQENQRNREFWEKNTKKVIRENRGAKFGSVCHQSAYHSM